MLVVEMELNGYPFSYEVEQFKGFSEEATHAN